MAGLERLRRVDGPTVDRLAEEVRGLVEEDMRKGVFPPDAVVIDEWATVHDYVDGNEYILQVLGGDALQWGDYEWSVAGRLEEETDALLRSRPVFRRLPVRTVGL